MLPLRQHVHDQEWQLLAVCGLRHNHGVLVSIANAYVVVCVWLCTAVLLLIGLCVLAHLIDVSMTKVANTFGTANEIRRWFYFRREFRKWWEEYKDE